MDNKESEFYYYLGKTNSGEWRDNLSSILQRKIIRMKLSDIHQISSLLDYKNIAQYNDIVEVVNSRFSYCWFLNKCTDGIFRHRHYWDMCIQMFDDEWFLVNIGSGDGSCNYWYMCDQFDGLKQLIKDKLT